jgi:cytochrome b involved in lipid metabolism
MGWLAAGCSTLIAGYVLYKFCIRSTSDQPIEKATLSRSPLSPPLEAQRESISARSKELSPALPAPPVVPNLPTIETDRTIEGEDAMPEISVNQAEVKSSHQPPTIVTRSSSPPRLKPPTFGGMPAPPRPGNGLMRPPPSAAATLRVPPQKALPNTSMAPTSSIMAPGKQVSRKVILEPGHSPLDWAALTSDPNARLRGKDASENLIRVTPGQLKRQNGRKGRDAWTIYRGKVYNISPYVPFHPGGAGELLRGAGKDSVKLFMEVHPWVNWEGMLSECLVGILVGDEDEVQHTTGKTNNLDDMD